VPDIALGERSSKFIATFYNCGSRQAKIYTADRVADSGVSLHSSDWVSVVPYNVHERNKGSYTERDLMRSIKPRRYRCDRIYCVLERT